MKIKHIFTQLKSIRMTDQEKSGIRMRLIDLTKANATHAPQRIQKTYTKPQKSPWGAWHFVPQFRFASVRVVGAAVLILLITSTGVSFAAEQTLPGDLLYPVKINVNEEVRGALIVSHEGKMDWEKERVVRRVVETETLLKTNKFTPERKVEAEIALKNQMDTFAAAAAETSAKDPSAVIAATAELEPALKVHQEVIASIAANPDTTVTPTETAGILDTVAAGITTTSQQETVAIEVAVDKNPDTLASLTDSKITNAMTAIDTTEPTDETVGATDDASNAPADDAESSSIASDTTIGTNDSSGDTKATDTTLGTKSETKTDAKTDGKTSDSKTDGNTKDTDTNAADSTASGTKDNTESSVASLKASPFAAATPANQDPKAVLASAKAKLQQAKLLREQGDLKGALVLAQDAYKDIVALKLQSEIAKKAAKDSAKQESKADPKADITTDSKTDTKTSIENDTKTTPKGEVKGVQTDTTTDTDAKTDTSVKVEDVPASITTPLLSPLKK